MHMAQLMPLPLTVSCFSKIQIGFTFLVLAHLGSPGQSAVKRVCVCVCVCVCYLLWQVRERSSAMLSGVHGAREHLPQRADLRDRPPSMTYSEPRGHYSGDVGGQYRERESTSRDQNRGPATTKYVEPTQTTPPGLMIPPWNKIPGQSRSLSEYFVEVSDLLLVSVQLNV